jgi:hypothetical protein
MFALHGAPSGSYGVCFSLFICLHCMVHLVVLMGFAFLYSKKELFEKHNLWLDEELKAKVENLAK